MSKLGKLYLVPAPLDFGCATQSPITDVLPELTLRTAARLQHWVCENAKSTRAYLKRVGELPRWLRNGIITFSGVASNFAGVPLAFAFIATLGRLGFVTMLLRNWFGINLYGSGFNIVSFLGLALTYLYFQIPLMVLIITPALEGLRREWREAAESLGATGAQYWRMVALPVLWPSLLGTLALLFANAFGAVATAIALTGSSLSIAPIVLFAQIRGDVLNDPHLGYAIAFGMILLTAIANGIYILLRMRAERWVK